MNIKRICKIIFVFLIICVSVGRVYASDDGHSANSGGIASCSSGDCFSGTVGFRITILNKKTGRRCKYDPNTNSICGSESGPEPNWAYESQSRDLWLDQGRISTRFVSPCYAAPVKRTKAEFVSQLGSTAKEISMYNSMRSNSCFTKNAYQPYYVIQDIGFPPIYSRKYWSYWKTLQERYGDSVPENIDNIIIDWLNCKEGANGDCKHNKALDGSTIGPDYNDGRASKIFDNIFNFSFFGKIDGITKNGKKIKITDVYKLNGIENAYIQFDEIIFFRNVRSSGYQWSVAGTAAEVSLFYKYYNNAKWCFAGNVFSQVYNQESCNASAIQTGYISNLFGKWSIGSASGVDSNFYLRSIDKATSQANQSSGLIEPQYQRDTQNIIHYKLHVEAVNKCNEDLQKNVMTAKNETQFNKAIEDLKKAYVGSGKYCKKLSDCKIFSYSYSELKMAGYFDARKGQAICKLDIPCSYMAQGIYDNIKNQDTLKDVSHTFYSSGSGTDPDSQPLSFDLVSKDGTKRASNYKDAMEMFAFNLSGAETKLYSKSVWNMKRVLVLGKSNSCSIQPGCNETELRSLWNKYKSTKYKDTLYKNYLDYLASLYQDIAAIYEDVWKELGYPGPSCDPIPKCEPTKVSITCGPGSTNEVELKDYEYDNNNTKCWAKGWASTKPKVFSAVTPKDSVCTMYCAERAVITLPGETSAKAGRLLKWGMDLEENDRNVFGKMRVYKKCIVRKGKGSCQNMVMSYTPDDIKATVKTQAVLKYKDAMSKSYETYNAIETKFIKGSDEAFNKEKYKCANADCSRICSNAACTSTEEVTPVEMYADFDFVYKEDYKWYSSKEDGSFVLSSKRVDYKENAYYEVGYGLKTSFTTPNGYYGINTGAGELTVEISKIGTQYDKGGRLDHLSKELPMTYSCKYKIRNELYGDECEYDPNNSDKLTDESPNYCDKNGGDGTVDGSVKDIDVVFRTIDLVSYKSSDSAANLKSVKLAFPGRTSSSTRQKGINWSKKIKDKDGILLTEEEAITNRIAKLLNSDVYSEKDPMYKIVLTSPTIKEIRDYNKKARTKKNRDPYTDFTVENINDTQGYTGYQCSKDGEYRFCASKFLSKLYNMKSNGSKTLSGSCIKTSNTKQRAVDYAIGKGCKQEH